LQSTALLGGQKLRTYHTTAAQLTLQIDAIPQGRYKSWSLFLISNPEWLLQQSDDRLKALYNQFVAFGKAIGDENLAVWFLSDSPSSSEPQQAVDVARSVAFCKRFKLNPSEGPYVLVLTKYPGACVLSDPNSFPKDTSGAAVIKLNSSDAASTTRLLSDLVVKIDAEDLSKLHSDAWWEGLRRVFTTVSTSVLGLSSKVTVVFNTGPVKTEIKLGP
jgi:hypothetical protein